MWKLCYLLAFVAVTSTEVSAVSPDHKESQKFTTAYELPAYIPHGVGERLMRAKENNFYSKFANTASDARDFATRLEDVEAFDDDSEQRTCLRSILKTAYHFATGRKYAREMRDSMGRRESGLLRGNFLWLGSYFECKAAEGQGIKARWCSVLVSDQPDAVDGLNLGICVPDVCKAEELEGFLQPVISQNGTVNNSFAIVSCPPDKIAFDAGDIVATIVYSSLFALVIAGTAFEATLIMQAKTTDSKGLTAADEAKLSAVSRLGVSFSLIKNTRMLLNTKRKKGNLDALDGMRFISMTWIVLGHTLSTMLLAMDNILDVMQYFIDHGSLQAIANSTFSVDTFFFLSGLLVAYVGMREMDKTGGKLNVPLMYLNRYLRLTPAMAVVTMTASTIYEQFGDGPLYYSLSARYAKGPCQKYWWTNLLYINNLYPKRQDEQCIGWVWYLANDMQFYLLSPIFLYLFYRKPKAGYIVIAAITIISMGITGGLSALYNMTNDVVGFGSISHDLLGTGVNPNSTLPPPTEDSYWKNIYIRPWCRIGVYLIGMTTGYVLHKTKRNIKMNKIFAIVMWIVVIAVELAVIYGFTGTIYNNIVPSEAAMAFYNAVSRPVWGLGLAWVVIACSTGYGGPINTFLSWKVFAPLSRLTYCAYLMHPAFLMYMYSAREYEAHFQICILIYYFLAALVFSYLLAYGLSMMVEAPMAGIQKVIFPRSKPSNAKPKLSDAVIENGMVERDISNAKKLSIADEFAAGAKEMEVIASETITSDRL